MFAPDSRTKSGLTLYSLAVFKPLLLLSLMVVLILSTFAWSNWQTQYVPVEDSSTTATLSMVPDFNSMPLPFIANEGQAHADVRFYAHDTGGSFFFTPGEVVISTRYASSPIQLRFDGANPSPRMTSTSELPGVVNYLIGSDPAGWHTNLTTYEGIVYEQIYPGIDLHYEGTEGVLKSTYIVAPAANPSDIRWHYEGVSDVQVDTTSGNLLIMHEGASEPVLIEQAPIAWQTIDGERVPVEVRYVVDTQSAQAAVRFAVGTYDPAYELVIDPTIIFSVFVGDGSDDIGNSITTDSEGNVYITGQTNSSLFSGEPLAGTNPPGSVPDDPEEINPDNSHVFVAKYSSNGTPIFVSYLGGDDADVGYGIAVDMTTIETEQGETKCHPCSVYITGFTDSTNFPTAQPIQPSNGGARDIFVTKLISTGLELEFSTYLGGSDSDEGLDIATHEDGNASITGHTLSSDFPTLNPIQGSYGGGATNGDAFLASITNDGSALNYSTYLGGASDDRADAIALDANGNAYIAGSTDSDDFPQITPFQTTVAGGTDAFVSKVSADGTALSYSTYIGGSQNDRALGVAVDDSGNAYITGVTASTDFPTEVPLQATKRADTDGFVTKFSTDGSTLVYSTYLGGDAPDEGHSIVVDSVDRALVTGLTRSENFPEVATLLRSAGRNEAFVARFSDDGTELNYSTYLAGEADDDGRDIAYYPGNNTFYVTGFANSASRFPGGPGAHRGGSDAFITKFAASDVLIRDATDVAEEDGGTQEMVFAVELTFPTGEDIEVRYRTRDGTGETAATTADGDYDAVTDGSVTIPSGETVATVTIPINGDVKDELDEQFIVELTETSGETEILDAEATGTILDNDPGVIIDAVPPASGSEGSDENATFRVSLIDNRTKDIETPNLVEGQQWQHPLTVNYTTANGTARSGEDYEGQNGTLTFEPGGNPQQDIVVTLLDDTRAEIDETFRVDLTQVGGTASLIEERNSASFIINDDDLNGIAIQNPPSTEIIEGDEGTQLIEFNVELPLANPREVTVEYQTVNGTAVAGEDFVEAIGTLTFPACTNEDLNTCPLESTRQTLVVTVTADLEHERDEIFGVTLTSAAGGVEIVRDTSEITIINDDFPEVEFGNQGTITVNEGNTGDAIAATVPVTLSYPSLQNITVDYETSNSPAGEGTDFVPAEQEDDYTPASGTLEFPAGSTLQQFEIPITSDDVGEPNETINLTLSEPTKATLGERSQGTLIILDDDPFPAFEFSQSSYSIAEEAGQATITVTLINGANITIGEEVAAGYTTLDGSAVSGSDYEMTTGELTFTAPFTEPDPIVFTVPIINDRENEADEETIILELNSPRPLNVVRVGPPVTATLTVLDDERTYFSYLPVIYSPPPSLQFSSAIYSVSEDIGTAVITVTLTDPSVRQITVDYSTLEDENTSTAVVGSDYEVVSGTLTFEPGETEQSFAVPILDDANIEVSELFFVRLSNVSPGASLTAAVATVQIQDDDAIDRINPPQAAALQGVR